MTVTIDVSGDECLKQADAHSQPVRDLFNSVPTAVSALCATVDGTPRGLIATSLSVGVSYEPPMVSLSVLRSSSTWPILATAPRIGVSVLSATQTSACMQLASKAGDRFAGLTTACCNHDALFIDGATSWMECSIETTVPAGDHELVLLRIHRVHSTSDIEPLVFHRADFRRLEALDSDSSAGPR